MTKLYLEIGYAKFAQTSAHNTFILLWDIRKREHKLCSLFGFVTYPLQYNGCRVVEFETEELAAEFVNHHKLVKEFSRKRLVFRRKEPRVEVRRGRWCWKNKFHT